MGLGYAVRAWLAVAVVGSAAWPCLAMAQATTPGSRVLVMPFVATVEAGAPGGAGAALWLGEAASVAITEGLIAQGVAALSRDDREAAFDRLNLTMSGALTRATTLRVGELIGATEVVFGEVQLGANLLVRARLVRLDAGREVPAVVETGPLADIFEIFGRAAARLASQTGRFRPTSRSVPPMPLEAFENYVKGLVAATPAAEQRFLESAIRLAPTDPRILLSLWRAHSSQGQHDRALAAANAVAADAPVYRQARFAVALSLIELRRYDGAYQVLSALATAERSAPVANALGVVQLRRGAVSGPSAAATYFKRALDEDPDNPDYLFNLGYAHATAGNRDEALMWLREVVRVDVADADAHLVMSTLLSTAGRAPEAQRELDLARLLGAEAGAVSGPARLPTDLERLPTSAHLSAGLRVRALASGPAQRDQRETAAFHLANGRALVGKQRDREAIDELRRAIYLAPYEDEPHLLLGQIYVRAGRVREAIDEFTVAVWCRDSVRARLVLAEALVSAGDRAQARTHVDRALVLDPQSAEAQALARRLAD